jgi:hypothetical protein
MTSTNEPPCSAPPSSRLTYWLARFDDGLRGGIGAMLRLALATVIALAACGSSDDPLTADMKRICNPKLDDGVPPDLQRIAALRDIADHIKSPEAARLLSSLMQAAPSERAALLGPALAKAKLKRCPFLEN